MCRESIALAIRSARRSTGCCSIISTGSCQNTRDVSRRSTGFAVLRREANEGGYFRPIVKEVVERYLKTLRIFFKFRRKLLGELCRSAVKTLTIYFEALTGEELGPGVIVAVQTFGDRINFHPHLHLLLTEGGVDRAGIFDRLPRLDDARLAEIFGPGGPGASCQ